MIILDTNVLSELMRPQPAAAVLDWTVRTGPRGLWITAVTRAEILSGIAILPAGRRRQDLETAAHRTFSRGFAGPVLPFDSDAADHYARILALRRRRGQSISELDLMIVSIARARNAAVATRNVADFEDCGVTLHDPWGG